MYNMYCFVHNIKNSRRNDHFFPAKVSPKSQKSSKTWKKEKGLLCHNLFDVRSSGPKGPESYPVTGLKPRIRIETPTFFPSKILIVKTQKHI